MNDRIKIVFGLIISVLVVAGLLAWLVNAGSIGFAEISLPVIVLLLVFGAVYLFWNRAKAVKQGLPAEDELSKKALIKAGYYGFFAAIYGALGTMFYNSFALDNVFWPVLDADRTAEMIILISAIVFMASALYLTHKGNVQ
ncbi:MAG: hypothetical protein ABH986_00195 [archaeon]